MKAVGLYLRSSDMRYQLVLQWSSASVLEDYGPLIEIENLLLDKLGEQDVVDGHDAGSDEMNIFIVTDDPFACFERVKAILESRESWATVRVGYREISETNFKPYFRNA